MDVKMIEIHDISKTYNKTKMAVDHLSIDFDAGAIVAFIGPNGAGKTTTLKMMTGILKPDSGSITINGYDIQKDPITTKQQFGFVFDDPNAFLKLKGLEYLNFMADIYKVDATTRQERITTYTQRLGIFEALNDKIASYSHGMRQKIMIVGALIHDPALLILDEPLTGLDPQSAFNLKEIMRERAQAGKTVIFSTHILEVAEKLCDQIAIINHGKLIYEGTLESLKTNYKNMSLEAIFLEVTQ